MNKELHDTNTDNAIIRNQNLTTRMNSTDSMNNTIINYSSGKDYHAHGSSSYQFAITDETTSNDYNIINSQEKTEFHA